MENPSLLICLMKTYAKDFVICLIPLSILMTCSLVQAYLVGEFITVLIINKNITQGIGIAME